MSYTLYQGTRIGLALKEALEEMEEYDQISPRVSQAILRKFNDTICDTFQNQVENTLTLRADRLWSFRFCDSVWQLLLQNVEFLTANGSLVASVNGKIREDVRAHRIVVFREQGGITPGKHLEIGRWFGDIESTFYNHPKSPHRDIFRVSNDRSEGCTNVGRTGWHIDGSFQAEPFSHSLYHIINVPTVSSTSFLPLTDLIEGLDDERRQFWDSLWMVSDSRDIVHPLIYSHPETGKPVLCFHLGMIGAFVQNFATKQQKIFSPEQSQQVLDQIQDEITKHSDLIYHHKYLPGDFIISDNLAVGHEASPDTQLPRSQIGLRVMHRVTIAGKHRPKK